MSYARITGIGGYLPGQPISNRDLVARGVNTSDEWIVERTGIRNRYFAGEDQSCSDLALEASRAAIAHAGIVADKVDLIVLATSTPDYVFPSTACAAPGETRHPQRRRGHSTCRRCAADSSTRWRWPTSSSARAATACAGGRRGSLLAHPRLERPLDLRAVRRRRRGGGARGRGASRAFSPRACTPTAVTRTSCACRAAWRGGHVVGTPLLRMDGQAVFKFAVKVLAEVARRGAGPDWAGGGPGRLAGSAPGERAHPAGHRAQARPADGQGGGHGGPSTATLRRPRCRWRSTRRYATGAIRPARTCCSKAWAAGSPGARCCSGSERAKAMKFAFVFPGQGSQAVGMMQAFAGAPAVARAPSTRPPRRSGRTSGGWSARARPRR